MSEEYEGCGAASIGDTTPMEERNILRLENAEHQMVVNITGYGKTEFGPGYKNADQAAKLFWECIGSEYGSMKRSLKELVDFIEGHKAMKNTDPVQALVDAKRILGRG